MRLRDMVASPYWLLLFQSALLPLSRAATACYMGCDCLLAIKYVNCSGGNFSMPVSNFPYNTEYLDLSGNLLTTLPPGSFGALWNLRVLLLNENNISSVANRAFIGLQSLQRLDLSQNRLAALGTGFSFGLESLSELVLAQNRIAVLGSGTFGKMDSLVKLDLSDNLIGAVRPHGLSGMTALRRLRLDGNQLARLDLELFSNLPSLEVLGLRGNRINVTEPGAFTSLSSLVLLDLAFNRLTGLGFMTLLSIHTTTLHVLLEGNPWHCDCDLQRVFRRLATVQRLFLDDYWQVTCSEPAELRGSLMAEVDTELCLGETVTVIILSVTVLITVVAAIVLGDRNKRGRPAKECTEESGSEWEAYYDN